MNNFLNKHFFTVSLTNFGFIALNNFLYISIPSISYVGKNWLTIAGFIWIHKKKSRITTEYSDAGTVFKKMDIR